MQLFSRFRVQSLQGRLAQVATPTATGTRSHQGRPLTNMPQGGRNGSEPVITQEIAAEIILRLSAGESLLSICKTEGYPTDTAVRKRALADPDFGSEYARARDLGLDTRADRVLEIARGVDKDDVPRARLEFDAERWYLSKLAPKRYGDATTLKHADPDGNAINFTLTRVDGKKP